MIHIKVVARLRSEVEHGIKTVSNIEVAGIATIVLSVAVLAVVLLSAW